MTPSFGNWVTFGIKESLAPVLAYPDFFLHSHPVSSELSPWHQMGNLGHSVIYLDLYKWLQPKQIATHNFKKRINT